MIDSRTVRYPSFVGAKCEAPIPWTGGVCVDALVQASLDRDVRAIQFLQSFETGGHTVRLDGVIITTGTERSLLQVTGLGGSHDLEETGSALLALERLGIGLSEISARFLFAEPRHRNHRTVWHCRHVPVTDTVRHAALLAIEEASVLTLGDLASRIDANAPIESIYSLACADLLSLDLMDSPLSLHTVVRSLPNVGPRIEPQQISPGSLS